MKTIDPMRLKDYVDRKIFKYEAFCVDEIELDEVHGYVEFNDSIVVRINSKDVLVDLPLDEILLFETLKEAKIKQVLDVHAVYTGRYKSAVHHFMSAAEYYNGLIDAKDFEFFILSTTNYQLREEEYRKILSEIVEKNPEYLI